MREDSRAVSLRLDPDVNIVAKSPEDRGVYGVDSPGCGVDGFNFPARQTFENFNHPVRGFGGRHG